MLKLLLLPALLLFAWLWNLDVVDSGYATRAELDAQGGGWLPPILPGSARDIHTVNNLDLDVSQGEFAFSDTDAGAFFARLSLDVPQHSRFANWRGIVDEYRASGHVAWSYREGGETWVFFCHPAEDACDYLTWRSSEPSAAASPKQTDTRHQPQ